MLKKIKYVIYVLIFVISALFIGSVFADDLSMSLVAGDTLTVDCDSSNLSATASSPSVWTLVCSPFVGETATPVFTKTPPPPQPTPVPTLAATATPLPSNSQYGDFPNGKNGGVCAESHAWWHENGEDAPRHSHSAACVPAARGKGGQDGPTLGSFNVASRALSFNSPGEVNWHRAQWQGDTVKTNNIGSRCQNSIDEFKECVYWVSYNLNTRSGIDELRLATDMRHSDLGTRQYSVINFQVKGNGSGSYRSGPWIIGRHWYDGFGYVRVYLYDYMEYVKPGESMPNVSGTFNLKVKHDGSNCTEGQLYINPNFHEWHSSGTTPPAPYETTSCNSTHTYSIDTTKLSNGRQTLYFQTIANDSRGELASAVLVFVNVQN